MPNILIHGERRIDSNEARGAAGLGFQDAVVAVLDHGIHADPPRQPIAENPPARWTVGSSRWAPHLRHSW